MFGLYYICFIVFVGLIAVFYVNNKWIKSFVGLGMLGFVFSVGVLLGQPKPVEISHMNWGGANLWGFYIDKGAERFYFMVLPKGSEEPILLSSPFGSKEEMEGTMDLIEMFGLRGTLQLNSTDPTEPATFLYPNADFNKEGE